MIIRPMFDCHMSYCLHLLVLSRLSVDNPIIFMRHKVLVNNAFRVVDKAAYLGYMQSYKPISFTSSRRL